MEPYTYVYCGLEVSEGTLKFSNGLKTARTQLGAEKINFIMISLVYSIEYFSI